MRYGILLLVVFFVAYNTYKRSISSSKSTSEFIPDYRTGPPAIVYKTKANYDHLVPVLLSDDKKESISYPHPSDLKVGNLLVLPTLLNKGYLLDNRGIGKNVAFLKLTYEEYAKLDNAPTLKELYELIIDKAPLTELCNCGNKKAFTDPVTQINKLIDSKMLRTTCRIIK